MKKLNWSVYFRNILMPFITGGLLAFALTNTIAGFGVPFTLNAQIITVVVPWVFWLVAMSSSHPWTMSLNPRVRAVVSSVQAGVVGLIWIILTSLGSSSISLIIVLLQLVVALAFVGTSFLNAFFVAKEEQSSAKPAKEKELNSNEEIVSKKPVNAAAKKNTTEITKKSTTASKTSAVANRKAASKKNPSTVGKNKSASTKKPVSSKKPATTKKPSV